MKIDTLYKRISLDLKNNRIILIYNICAQDKTCVKLMACKNYTTEKTCTVHF